MPDNHVQCHYFKNPSTMDCKGLHVESFDEKDIAIWMRNGNFPPWNV